MPTGRKFPAMIRRGRQTGLSLVEVSITIVILGLGLTAVLGMLIASNERGADAQIRVKQAELAESYMEQILATKYDQKTSKEVKKSYPNGGLCVHYKSEGGSKWGENDCQNEAKCPGVKCGDDGESRGGYNDVDDFDDLKEGESCGFGPIKNSNGAVLGGSRYEAYCVWVRIDTGVGADFNLSVGKNDAKRVRLRVAGPDCQDWEDESKPDDGFSDCGIEFTSYKLNF